jgi:hypothetical protein
MKNLKLYSILFVVCSMAIISCSKGTAGPAGPQGPPGPGNVQHTAWITLSTAYVGKDSNGDSVFQQAVTAASITQTILDSGLVLSYILQPDGSIVEVSDLSIFLDVSYSVGTITLTSFGVDLSTNYSFRYVIIPGTTTISSSLGGYTKAQLKAMPYNQISKLLGLQN